LEPSTPGHERQLAAILYADAVGFSRQMGEAEAATHIVLKLSLDLAAGVVTANGGRMVGCAGDAFLAVFPSVVAAVRAADAFQSTLAQRRRETAGGRQLTFRVGVHLGDVIVDGVDVFGEGVNLAAPVQTLAEPGGTVVTAAVHDQVRGRLDLDFEDLGGKRVKNIEQPVHVFAARNRSARPAVGGARMRADTRRQLRVVAAIVVSLLLVVAAAALGHRFLDRQAATPSRDGRPTIGVQPFQGEDEGDAFFRSGVTEDVIAQLGRFSGLIVQSWNAVAPYGQAPLRFDRLADELDVRYIVHGSLRRSADRLRANVQLSDAERGVLLRSERYDEPMADLFAVQDKISRSVAAALSVRLIRLEQARAVATPQDDLSAYELVLRGRAKLRAPRREANLEARSSFNQALALDTTSAAAHVGLGWTHAADVLWGWSEWPVASLAQAEEHARRAVALNAYDASAHALLADALRFQGRLEEAEEQVLRAIALNPNDAVSHAIHGCILLYSGSPGAAIPALEQALRLDPILSIWARTKLAQSYYLQREFEAAVRLLSRPDIDFAQNPAPHAVLAAALAQLGREAEAREAARGARGAHPFFDAEGFATNIADPGQSAFLLEGLQKAGF